MVISKVVPRFAATQELMDKKKNKIWGFSARCAFPEPKIIYVICDHEVNGECECLVSIQIDMKSFIASING